MTLPVRLSRTAFAVVAMLTMIAVASLYVNERPTPATAAGENSVELVDDGSSKHSVGQHASMVLDSSGYPVIAYYDMTVLDLKVARCTDVSCTGDTSINTVDSAGSVGTFASLVLDASGFPVVSYYDATNQDLKVLHCNDLNCAGGDESITSPDTTGIVGEYSTISLDASGFPVVVSSARTTGGVRIMHCNDANCAGLDENYSTVDIPGTMIHLSHVLDANGYPVVSYQRQSLADLKVLRCNDANCDGAGESVETVDSAGVVGAYTSIVLDALDNPVISYYDATDDALKVVHCDDANCAVGGDFFANPVANGGGGEYTSIELDALGRPVVSYFAATPDDLVVMICNDANCDGALDPLVSVDTAGLVGEYSSLELDNFDRPIVAYWDRTNGDLKTADCRPSCATPSIFSWVDRGTVLDSVTIGLPSSMILAPGDIPVIAYRDVSNGDLKVARCNDANCAGVNESLQIGDAASAGDGTSVKLDSLGYPVVAYFKGGSSDLGVLHCNDPLCEGGDESVTSPDTVGTVGRAPSLALDASGFPVISYYDVTNGDLKVMHCDDANCAGGGESITSPDTGGDVGVGTSLALDGSGNPVIAYEDTTNGDLKVMHCNDANCAGGDESITSPDAANIVGSRPSLTLDGSGRPVIAHSDVTNTDLRLVHCNDVDCAGSNESLEIVDGAGTTGFNSSLALDGSGNPVIAYYATVPGNELRVVRCNDTNCAGGNDAYTAPLSGAGVTGFLVLDASGFPVVSYQDGNSDLSLLHCGTVDCVEPPVCPGDADCDTFLDPAPTAHQGPANTSTAVDNCPSVANADQLNRDGNFNDNSPPYSAAVDDKTWADSDALGNACDPDDDNDGLADGVETVGPPCGSATAATDPLNHDSDGDRYLDGIECTLGTDPASSLSKPLLTACAPAGDTDGDKLSDRIEVCLYGTDPVLTDTDGDKDVDGGRDGCEAASFNGDRIVNVADMGMLAAAISTPAMRIANVDVNKDGAFNPADSGLVASFISPSGQCPG